MIRGNKTNSGPSNTSYSLWEGYAYFLWCGFSMCVCVRAHIASYCQLLLFFISPFWNKCSSGFLSVMGHHIRMFLHRWRRPRRGCEGLWWEERSFMWCFETHYAPPDEGNIGGGSVGGMTSVKQQWWRACNYDYTRNVHWGGSWGWELQTNCRGRAHGGTRLASPSWNFKQGVSVGNMSSAQKWLRLNKCNSLWAKCCANLKLMPSTCRIVFPSCEPFSSA